MPQEPVDGPAGKAALEPMLRKLQYSYSLGKGDRAALMELPVRVLTIERHHFVIRERGVAKHACVLLKGFAVRSKMVANRSRRIVSIGNGWESRL